MQLQRNTSTGKQGTLIRISIKVLLIIFLFSILMILIDKIDFPYPNKKIEKIISNENLKVIK
jgi:hypothetical protein|tara:strand:- start:2245 stop:2430 length:186 start_codon:yes stop_codon:yes gene_type:complete